MRPLLELMEDWAPQMEQAAVVFSLLYVFLAARRNIWCWLFGGLASAISVVLFITVKLYAESALYFFYVVMAVYGWWQWGKARGDDGDFRITEWRTDRHVLLIVASGIAGVALFSLLSEMTDAEMPFADAMTTTFSIAATFLVARKVLSNWIYWIAIDALSVWLYYTRGLDYFALLMLLYTGMAAYGFVQWRKVYHAQEPLPRPEEPESDNDPKPVVVITGPECSGKTTLAKDLSKATFQPWAEEQARAYLEQLEQPYTSDDLLNIAGLQMEAILQTSREAGLFAISDTGPEVVLLWHRDKLGPEPAELRAMHEQFTPVLYLLCRPDIPFEEDPLREDPHRRDELFEQYRALLKDRPVVEISGTRAQRNQKAMMALVGLVRGN